MNNLAQRVITAVIAIPVVFFLLWFCDYTRIGLMVLLGGVGAWEWAKMATKKYGGPDVRFVALLSSVLLTLAWAVKDGSFFGIQAQPSLLGIIVLLVLAIYIAIAYAKVEIETLFPWLVMQLGAPLYLGLWGGMNVTLMKSGQGFEQCYAFLLLVTSMWGCDTVAYFFGKFVAGKGPFGRHLFAPTISPKKTWEGAFAGTIFTMFWVMFLAPKALVGFGVEFDVVTGLLLGLLFAVAGQAGDLLMSALKRWSGTKDSGNLFVGHGGVLDRCDSFYLAAPMLVLLLDFLK